MTDFHFLRPIAFLLIPLLLVLLYSLWKKKRTGGVWSKYCAKHLQPYMLLQTGAFKGKSLLILAVFGLLTISALAGPSWEKVSLPLVEKKHGLVIAIHLSPSLYAEDIKPSRLQRTLYKIKDILKRRNEGQTALLVYTDEAFVVTPLSNDSKTIAALLPSLDPSIMPTQGLNHSKAIAKAEELLEQAGVSDGSILLVTTEAGTSPLQSRFPVSILGVGTEQGAPLPKAEGGFHLDPKGGMIFSKLNPTALSKLAERTGGKFAAISADDSDIDAVLENSLKVNQFGSNESLAINQSIDNGYWLVLLALPAAALLLRRGGYLTLAVVLCTSNLQAISWVDLWKTKDQKAEYLYSQEHYEEAAATFENREWRAASLYKSGKYDEAAKLYENAATPDDFYNYGNALAKQGKLDQAIAAYDKTLNLDPAHEDAAYNKKLLEDLKQEQQQQQDNKENEGEDSESQKGEDNPSSQDHTENGDDNESNDKQSNSASDDSQHTQQNDQTDELTDEDQSDYSESMDQQQTNEQEKQEEQEIQSTPDSIDPDDRQQEMDNRLLERIPDDPGALLRRKFLYQYRNQKARS